MGREMEMRREMERWGGRCRDRETEIAERREKERLGNINNK